MKVKIKITMNNLKEIILELDNFDLDGSLKELEGLTFITYNDRLKKFFFGEGFDFKGDIIINLKNISHIEILETMTI